MELRGAEVVMAAEGVVGEAARVLRRRPGGSGGKPENWGKPCTISREVPGVYILGTWPIRVWYNYN
jgi:hypothetical protein